MKEITESEQVRDAPFYNYSFSRKMTMIIYIYIYVYRYTYIYYNSYFFMTNAAGVLTTSA